MTVFRTVTPDYFEALGIAIRAGRPFTENDRSSNAELAILSESLAKRLFGNQDPVGRQMRSGLTGPWRTIVGVAADVKNAGLTGADDPEYYYLWRRNSDQVRRRAHYVVRSDSEPVALAQLIRSEIAALDPTLPLTITTMNQNLARHIQRPRFESLLLTLFAAAGMLLAGVGQFGVVSYLVTQRSAEIGVRMALGATTRDIVGMIVRQTLAWTLLGAATGLGLALWSAKFIESMLFGVKTMDVLNFAAVLALLTFVALISAWRPSHRAAHLDPVKVLRHE
jgi:putative ABC transport system permease protein